MTEQKTTLVYEAQAKGFAETQRAIEGANKAVDQGGKTTAKNGRDAEATLAKLVGALGQLTGNTKGLGAVATQVERLGKALGGHTLHNLSQVATIFDRMAQSLARGGGPPANIPPIGPTPGAPGGGGAGGSGGGPPASTGPIRRPPGPSGGAAQGSLVQGLLEGLISGNLSRFIQRGPGAMTQAAGIMLGQSVRGAAGTAADFLTSPLHGTAGMQQALAGIPIVGGLAGAALSDAQTGLNYQRQLFGDASMLGRGFLPGRPGVPTQAAMAAAAATARHNVANLSAEQVSNELHYRSGGLINFPADSMGQAQANRERLLRAETAAEQAAAIRRAAQPTSASDRLGKSRLLNEVRGVGQGILAEDNPSTLRFLTQLASGAGVQAASLGDPGLFRHAAAVSSVYGVSPGSLGAFQMAANNGAMRGVGGSPSQMMDRALQDAVSNGLEGSGLTDAMDQIAQDIRGFATTGIPVAPGSLQSMAESARTQMGVGIERAQGIARSTQAAMHGIGVTGPTSGLQAFLVQHLVGMGNPLTASNVHKALRSLRENNAPGLQEAVNSVLYSQYQAASGGRGAVDEDAHARGLEQAMRVANEMGVTINDDEMERMVRQQAGTARDPNDPVDRANAQRLKGRGKIDPAGEAARKRGAYPQIFQEAVNQNRQLESGTEMMQTAVALEDSFSRLEKLTSDKLSPSITSLANGLDQITAKLDRLIRKLSDYAGDDDAPTGSFLGGMARRLGLGFSSGGGVNAAPQIVIGGRPVDPTS